MFAAQRPALASQSWKISLLNYFLAALVGCGVGSVCMGIMTIAQAATPSPLLSKAFALAFGTAVFLIFSLPYAILGLAPIVLGGEVLARKTTTSPLVIAGIAMLASIPIALWMFPEVRFTDRSFIAISFGLLVTGAWLLLSFRPDGFASALRSASDV